MKSVLVSVLMLVVLFLSFSCNEGYDYSQASLGLGLRDYSCTEAWIEVQIGSNDKTANIYIKKNGEIIQTVNVVQSSTLYYFDSLLPNTNYTFDAVTYEDGKEVKSNPVTFKTLDTTSHNFTWQTFTFGEHQHSVLYDVAVIDENNIWAVGVIYMNDSLGNPDTHIYNAVHWNGQVWELKRIKTLFRGNIITVPLEGIFAFSATDIWMAGSLPIHGDGTNWTMYDVRITVDPNLSLSKVLGVASNNIYFIGRSGSIVHYQNGSWTKIESGTNVNLYNVWGTTDGKTIWTCGYTDDYGTSALIRIKEGISEKVFEGFSNSQNNGYYVGPMSGVWSDNEYRVFMMNWSGIYLQQNNNQFFLEKEIARFTDVGFGIDGTGYNNVFVCGEGFIGHWNGYSYKEYPELFQQQRTFKSVKANANTVCAVGLDYNSPIYSNAVIVLGKK